MTNMQDFEQLAAHCCMRGGAIIKLEGLRGRQDPQYARVILQPNAETDGFLSIDLLIGEDGVDMSVGLRQADFDAGTRVWFLAPEEYPEGKFSN